MRSTGQETAGEAVKDKAYKEWRGKPTTKLSKGLLWSPLYLLVPDAM